MTRAGRAPRRGRARRAAVPAATVLAAALLAGGVSSAASGTAGGQGSGVLLAAGQTGSRVQVPWSKVGPGWTLVEDAFTAQWTTPQHSGPVVLWPADGKDGIVGAVTYGSGRALS